jgi:hypothetical protein
VIAAGRSHAEVVSCFLSRLQVLGKGTIGAAGMPQEMVYTSGMDCVKKMVRTASWVYIGAVRSQLVGLVGITIGCANLPTVYRQPVVYNGLPTVYSFRNA